MFFFVIAIHTGHHNVCKAPWDKNAIDINHINQSAWQKQARGSVVYEGKNGAHPPDVAEQFQLTLPHLSFSVPHLIAEH